MSGGTQGKEVVREDAGGEGGAGQQMPGEDAGGKGERGRGLQGAGEKLQQETEVVWG